MNRFEQVDVGAFDRYFKGTDHVRSVKLYRKFADIFLKSFELKISELKRALENHEVQDARLIAHRLRSGLMSLGGNQLADVFQAIELGVGEKAQDYFLGLLQVNEVNLSQFIQELSVWLESLEASI